MFCQDLLVPLPAFQRRSNTARSMVNGTSWRATRFTMSRNLEESTALTTGESFIKAWFQVVTCHAFLRKNHIEQGDPSLSNMMYDPETKCGVLTDFDLAPLQWELRVIGMDTMGTIPFMAIDLLSEEYWQGTRKHYYHHELEALIWMIPFLFLSYNDGKRQPNEYIDSWKTSNYATCRKEKYDFLQLCTLLDAQSTIQPNYKDFWPFMYKLIRLLTDLSHRRDQRLEILVENQAEGLEVPLSAESEDMWDSFTLTLEQIIKAPRFSTYGFSEALKKLKSVKPDFIDLSDESKVALYQEFEEAGYLVSLHHTF